MIVVYCVAISFVAGACSVIFTPSIRQQCYVAILKLSDHIIASPFKDKEDDNTADAFIHGRSNTLDGYDAAI